MGVYKRKGSRFYWMSYTVEGSQIRESTKSTIRATAKKIYCQREAEVALGRFNIGRPGERMGFDHLAQEYERSHVKLLSKSSQRSYGSYAKHLNGFFAGRKISQIDAAMIEQYRDLRRQQPAKTKPCQLVKGATINRELEVLQGMLDWAVRHKYIPDNPAVGVEHFNENRERPEKKPVTAETFLRILSHAPLHLRVGMVVLEQTGNRTYSELFSLGKSQVDLDARLIRFVDTLKTPGSAAPAPLSKLACQVLRWWMEQQQGSASPYLFPSPRDPNKPIGSVKTAWRNTLRRAGVAYFPLYHLRTVFCTRVGGVGADAVVTRAMRHTSPETKLRYLLGMTNEIREAMEQGNKRFYGDREYHILSTVTSGGPHSRFQENSQVTNN